MPFESKAQQRFMHAQHPTIAKRWDKLTDFEDLPDRKVEPRKKKRGSVANIGRRAR